VAQHYIQDPYRLIGTTFSDEYRLEEYAGGGGLGAVYRATQISSGRQVAIKILKPDVVIRNPEYIDLFEREVKAVQNLDHPNIVKLFDSGSDQGISYMVMEWLEGQTLEELLSEERLSVDRVTHLFRQVCDAFAAAHKINIIHLDVKPANIFLLKDGSPQGSIKVIDFGMSRILTSESGTTVTRFLGTYQYCSPEHLGGKVSRRSDIYSLGVTLYHMITGTVPFGTSYINAKRHRNLEMPPVPSVRGIRPDFPSTVDQVIERALRKPPSERQQSVEEVFDEFYQAVSETSDDCPQTFPPGERIETRQPAGLRAYSAPQTATIALFIGVLLLSVISLLTYTQLYQRDDANLPDIPAVAQINQPQEARPAPSVTPPVTGSPGTRTSPTPAPSAPSTKPGASPDNDLFIVPDADADTASPTDSPTSSVPESNSVIKPPSNNPEAAPSNVPPSPVPSGESKPAIKQLSDLIAAQRIDEAAKLVKQLGGRAIWSELHPPTDDEKYKFGTLVFFNNLHHVGIVADENGFYHVSMSKGVVYSRFDDYWTKRINGFRLARTSGSGFVVPQWQLEDSRSGQAIAAKRVLHPRRLSLTNVYAD
jgi:serine/threonine protein kinase